MKYLFTLLMLLSVPVQAQTVRFDVARTVTVRGFIGPETVEVARKLAIMVTSSKDPVYVVINSQGGMIAPAAAIIVVMDWAKSKNIPVYCADVGIANSMAFNIFGHCSFRYVTKTSTMLFHYPGLLIDQPMFLNRDDMLAAAKQLEPIEIAIVRDLVNQLHASEDVVRKYCRLQTRWVADSINAISPNFVQVIDNITY